MSGVTSYKAVTPFMKLHRPMVGSNLVFLRVPSSELWILHREKGKHRNTITNSPPTQTMLRGKKKTARGVRQNLSDSKWWGSRDGEKSTSPLRMPMNISVNTSGPDVSDPLSQERRGLLDYVITFLHFIKSTLFMGDIDSIYLAPRLEETGRDVSSSIKWPF